MNQPKTRLSPPTTLREKLAQLIVVRIGSNLPPVRTVEQDAENIAKLLPDCPIGGLILFKGQRDTTPATLADLQSTSKLPMLVSSDIERGVGQQIHGPRLFPHAMAFEALGDDAEQTVEEFARLTALDARASGVHITFAPVTDVNVDPRNPIIATRAFGDDPERVAQLVTAFIRGCQAGGLLSTAKHYPGHGNTHEDSHHAVPTVAADRKTMDQCELIPFQAAIAAGVPLIMSAHVRYPALDETGAVATLSQAILIDLLRKQMGFEGAVVSDSFLMEGVKSQCKNEGELAVTALLAGVDILLDVAEPMEMLDALEKALQIGKLPEERVEEAFARLWHLKQLVFENAEPAEEIGLVEKTNTLANKVAVEAIRSFSDDGKRLPFDSNQKVCAILVRPYESHLDPPQQPLGAEMQALSPGCEYFELGPRSQAEDFERVLSLAANVEQVLVAVIVKPAAWHAFGLLPEQHAFVEQLTNQQPCVLVSLGTPEALHLYDNAAVKLCTYSDVPASQSALAERLFSGAKKG